MWRALWRSIDRFSLQYFKYIINELRAIKVVDELNREVVIDLLQSVVEIVTYGDKHDPSIFECFMEYQVLAEFVRMLKISRNSRIEAPLLQYLSIMIQNMDSEHAIYYCLSNDYINNIITNQYELDGGDIAPYYVSFLRAVSGKINKDTLCLLVKVHKDVVVSFPLYSEALKFAYHGEKMIQIAVRALTLNIYNVSDEMVHQFVTTPPVSEYFFDLVQSIRKQCFHLDDVLHSTEETCTQEKRKELLLATDKILDDLYYFKDILCVGSSPLSQMVLQNLANLLVSPILLPVLQLSQSRGLSPITSLYIVSRLLQVVEGKNMVNFVGSAILYSSTLSSMRDTIEENFKSNHLLGHLSEYMSSKPPLVSFPCDNTHKGRSGILSFISSDNHSLLLASLMLLLVVAESKDLDYQLASMIGFSKTLTRMQKTYDYSVQMELDGIFFERSKRQILIALLEVLASQPPFSVMTQWHAGWFLRKLLVFQVEKLNDYDLPVFNTSYEQSRERLRKELDGCWFDYIPDTLRNEWTTCKTALDESSQFKDPFFVLELACDQHVRGDVTASAWQRMIDAVKVFILHLQLKEFIFNGDPFENPMINLKSSSLAISGRRYTSDLSSASFGSEVALGSGLPCKIAFSKVGIRDIYMIPVARGISGNLLLVEKHPLHSKRGVVIAMAPLAGLSPQIDENHPTWLHLRVREFDPRFEESKNGGHTSNTWNHDIDGKWTLGFPSRETCEAALMLVREEIGKQRSSVESLLSPLLQDDVL